MANLTVTVAVTTGTQYVTGSTGSIYTFDGSQPASFTFPWVASGTVRLEQSGSSNDNHPLIFSTSNSSVLATMQAGIISSGVTYYLDGASNQAAYTNTTTFNAATTRYIEIAPTSETDFYFACWVHGIGMGGIMNMTQDTWGALSWSQGKWGEQNDNVVALTGVSATTSTGSLTAFNNEGWGRQEWGNSGWGVDYSVLLTGVSATTAVGTPLAEAFLTIPITAPSALTSSLGSPTTTQLSIAALTGLSATSSVGSFDNAGTLVGWGRNGWGEEPWGDSFNKLVQPSGVSATTSVGALTPADVVGLTGVSATTSLGSLSFTWIEFPTGVSATASPGSIVVEIGVPLTGVSSTVSPGALDPADVMGLTGVSATTSVGDPLVVNTELVDLTGVSATTSVGSVVTETAYILTGVSATSSVGAITPTEMNIGLIGVSATVSLGSGGVSPLHYKNVDITGNTSYTYVEHSA